MSAHLRGLRVVVTGGAGYVGSHVTLALRDAGATVAVIDDLSGGEAATLPAEIAIERADVTAPGVLARAVDRTGAQALLHFAARIQVGESVERPDLYYGTNVGGMLRVVEAAAAARIPVIFSSTAAVYGRPEITPIPVDHPCRPESPYGASKWMSERILADSAAARGFAHATLRYFNSAGARVVDGLGERHVPETHLIPLAIDAALGGAPLRLFGHDWPTRDGTCVRDYVHVEDLADAHLRALAHLLGGGASCVLNLGAGRGVTVREVIDAVGGALALPVPLAMGPRRAGDVATLVADIGPARALLAWEPTRSTIARIVADAVAARRR